MLELESLIGKSEKEIKLLLKSIIVDRKAKFNWDSMFDKYFKIKIDQINPIVNMEKLKEILFVVDNKTMKNVDTSISHYRINKNEKVSVRDIKFENGKLNIYIVVGSAQNVFIFSNKGEITAILERILKIIKKIEESENISKITNFFDEISDDRKDVEEKKLEKENVFNVRASEVTVMSEEDDLI